MGYRPLLRGTVTGLARAINVANAEPDALGLASVNPIFTFVRLAQRVPVRIKLRDIPEGLQLVAGMTATVQLEPPAPGSAPAPASAPISKAPDSRAQSEAAATAPSAPAKTDAVEPTTGRPPSPIPAAPPAPAAPTGALPSSATISGSNEGAGRNSAKSAAGAQIPEIPPSEYLGQTIDLFGKQTANPSHAAHAPPSLRRRAHARWRHYE